jgi:toxin ParE1/3/4
MTASAQKDIEGIWDYISNDNPLNAIDFIAELEEKIESLRFFPERNPIIPEGDILQTRQYRHIVHKKYRTIYRVEKDVVYILRIFHGAKLLDSASIDN